MEYEAFFDARHTLRRMANRVMRMAPRATRLLLAVVVWGGGCWFAAAAEPTKEAAPGASAAQPADAPASGTQPAAAQPTGVPEEQIAQLIQQLGDPDYYARQRAQDRLARLGFEAFDALNAATTHEDLEIAARAKYLLRLMRVEWTAKSDPPEVKRCLRDYEAQNLEGRQAKMRALAELPDDLGVAALCRLVRFEQSLLFSKLAATELLRSQLDSGLPKAALAESVRKALEGSKQPAAVWVLTWTRLGTDPVAAMQEWSRLIDVEQAALRHASGESRPEIVSLLVRFQVAQLKSLGKGVEALAALERLVTLEKGDVESLVELTDWLIEQQAWPVIDKLSQRFAMQFAKEPRLLYQLAEAYAVQNQEARASEAAQKAFGLYPGKQLDMLIHHIESADRLRRKGLFAWARREFEHIIKNGDPNESSSLTARVVLAEMLHDQGEELDAAKAMEGFVQALGVQNVKGRDMEDVGLAPKKLRARMHFFFACHWELQNDLAKRRESLAKALEASDDDVDVLIGCYRLPDQTAEYHAKIVELIKRAAAGLREQIAEDPEDSKAYNEFAWLIGNTEGDFDEALKFSRKSLEIEPKAGGYYDTLARVYFAKGDLEGAIKHQTRAMQLEPHSGQMRRQLELFRKTLAEKNKKP